MTHSPQTQPLPLMKKVPKKLATNFFKTAKKLATGANTSPR